MLARFLHEEGLVIRRELGDRRGIGTSLNNLGNVALDQGDFVEAHSRLDEALKLYREVGDRQYIATALNNLGNVVRDQGAYATARPLYDESLTISQELGDRRAVAYLLEDMDCLAAMQGEPERALRLVGAATALREAIGSPLSPAEQTKLESKLQSVRQALNLEAQAAMHAEGRAMPLDQAVDHALNHQSSNPH